MTLEQRISELEAQVAAMRREIRTDRVVVVDDDGRERVVLGLSPAGVASVAVQHPTVDAFATLQAGGDVESTGAPRASMYVSDGLNVSEIHATTLSRPFVDA